jgi:hypothetical protein
MLGLDPPMLSMRLAHGRAFALLGRHEFVELSGGRCCSIASCTRERELPRLGRIQFD